MAYSMTGMGKASGEIKNRTNIVEWMNNKNVRQFRDVAKIVTQYNEAPTDVLKQINKKTKSKK